MNDFDLRRIHRSFAELPDDCIEALASTADDARFPSGSVLFEADGSTDRFYIIRSGIVALDVASVGREPLVVETLGPGELVGVSWAFPPYRWNWRATARGDVHAVVFDAAAVREAAHRDPVLRTALLEAVATEAVDRLHATRMRLMDVYRGKS